MDFCLRVHLQDRGGIDGGEGTFHGTRHGIGFILAEGQQNDRFGFHDRPDAHRDDVMGDIAPGFEEGGVVGPGALGERLEAGPGGERRGRLIEPDMPVAADAKHLRVDAPGRGNAFLIGVAMGRNVRG